MKIACVDKFASDRLLLQKLVIEAFDCSREAIGHLAVLDFSPATKEEILIGGLGVKNFDRDKDWDGVILGSGYEIEELFSVASDFRRSSPTIPIFCFITPENFSIRILRRLEKISVEIFRTDDAHARIVHSTLKAISRPSDRVDGKLVTIEGAKGGQGTSSIAVGIAHAATAEGKSAVVIDLSKQGSLFHYLQTDKWQSSDYRTTLIDRLSPTKALLERLIVKAPNGVMLLLPPAGGAEIRELWMRSPQSFEISLGIIELLKERFDLVIVDIAHAEGLLPFSIVARADIRMVAASNEPAAVHQLNDKLTELGELPISSRTIVLLNMLVEHSLTSQDIEDYLTTHESAKLIEILTLPYDGSATNWIGTGNSIYTEGGSRLQGVLRSLSTALHSGAVVRPNSNVNARRNSKGLFARLSFRKSIKTLDRPRLPAPQPEARVEDVNFILTDEFKASFKSVSKIGREDTRPRTELLDEYQTPMISKIKAASGER